MIAHKGGLDHLLLTIGLEEEVDDVAPLVALGILDMMLPGRLTGLLQSIDHIKVHTGVLPNRLDHADTAEGLRKVDIHTAVVDLRGAQDLFRHMAVHGLGLLHHAVIVRVGLVELQEGEFRVMPGIQSLVAENAADLVDTLHAAHDQALQIQLQRDAQLQILIQGVVVGEEGAGSGAAGIGHQQRRLHLQKAPPVQKIADLPDNLGALDKGVPGLVVHEQVHIPLAVAQIRVGHAVVLLRQDLESLGQQQDLGGVDADLPGLGLENKAGDADIVAHIQLFEIGIGLIPQIVPGDIDLQGAGEVFDGAEGCLSHDALAHHSTGDADGFFLVLVIVLPDLPGVGVLVEACDLIGVLPCRLQCVELVPADLQQLAALRLIGGGNASFCHFLYLL